MTEEKCCPTSVPPFISDSDSAYVPKGTFIEIIGSGKIYVVGGANEAIILTYDIFGYHACTIEFCDLIAEICKKVVIMPDFFHGEPWPLEPWPLSDYSQLLQWIDERGNFTKLEPLYADASKYASHIGSKVVMGIGLCWGAKPMIAAHVAKYFSICATVHPSFLEESDAENLQGPICIITSKDDPDLKDFRKIVEKKNFGDKCSWNRFEDMHHGFCGARRDPSVTIQRERMLDAVNFISDFLSKAGE